MVLLDFITFLMYQRMATDLEHCWSRAWFVLHFGKYLSENTTANPIDGPMCSDSGFWSNRNVAGPTRLEPKGLHKQLAADEATLMVMKISGRFILGNLAWKIDTLSVKRD